MRKIVIIVGIVVVVIVLAVGVFVAMFNPNEYRGTIQAKLEQQGQFEGVGGLAYLAGLDLDLPDIGRIETYTEIVKSSEARARA